MMKNLTPLENVAEVLSGFAFKSEWFKEEGTKVIRIGDIENEKVNHNSCVSVDFSKYRVPDSCKAQELDILMALSGATTGKIGIVDKNLDGALVNQRVAIIRADNGVTQRYLRYVFSGEFLEKLLNRAWGAAQPNLSPRALRELKIPLPPLDEQRRIAAILDKADAVRRRRKKAIALTEDLLRSSFLEMFGDPVTNPKGWEVTELSSLLEFLTSGSRGWAKYYTSKGEPFLRIQNVKNGKLVLDDIAYVNPPKSAEANRTRVQSGDVLVSITADLGRTAVVPEEIKSAYINQHLALLRISKNRVSPTYLAAFLTSVGGQKQFNRLNREGVKAGLNFTDIKSLRILLPPLDKQQEYEKVAVLQSGISFKNTETRNAFDSLFNSLLQRAFRGDL